MADNSENFPAELGKKSEINSEKNPTDKSTIIISPTKDKERAQAPFTPPAQKEISEYFSERLSGLPNIQGPEYWAEWEARKFEEYYAAQNWKVGKAKMKDWKKAVTGWIGRSMERRTYLKPCPTAPDYNNFNQNGYGKEKNGNGPNRAELAFARALARSNGESERPGFESPTWKQPR
ncbi:MAG: hypothetical protein IPK76_27160 [Lewinellaceae bacterium]|nr:hypothetical protein [Lewinellaceae bacterium]